MASEAFRRNCLIYSAFNIMDMYEKRMKILENEAQVHMLLCLCGCDSRTFYSMILSIDHNEKDGGCTFYQNAL